MLLIIKDMGETFTFLWSLLCCPYVKSTQLVSSKALFSSEIFSDFSLSSCTVNNTQTSLGNVKQCSTLQNNSSPADIGYLMKATLCTAHCDFGPYHTWWGKSWLKCFYLHQFQHISRVYLCNRNRRTCSTWEFIHPKIKKNKQDHLFSRRGGDKIWT